jgi:aryl-alcohol dehydrogenase-like predicted oxidoreductase
MSRRFTRTLGRSGIEVSAMGLGCWAIGGRAWRGKQPTGYGHVDDPESIRAIHRALDLGVTFFDTADAYGAGHSERILGQALAGRRDRVTIATKFSNTFDEETRQIAGTDVSPTYIRHACEASLRRLNTDHIDLYQLHTGIPVAEAGPVLDTLDELVADGLIRAYGWSTDDPERARTFAQRPNCTAVQHGMNVFHYDPVVLALCDELALACICRKPLAQGLLSGKYGPDSQMPADDIRSGDASWLVYFQDGKPAPEWLEKLNGLRDILTSGGRTLVQGALAWIWARSGHTIPIPGFRNVSQVEENAGAMQFGPLRDEGMRQIDKILGRAPSLS